MIVFRIAVPRGLSAGLADRIDQFPLVPAGVVQTPAIEAVAVVVDLKLPLHLVLVCPVCPATKNHGQSAFGCVALRRQTSVSLVVGSVIGPARTTPAPRSTPSSADINPIRAATPFSE
jgi:hypothetical protein